MEAQVAEQTPEVSVDNLIDQKFRFEEKEAPVEQAAQPEPEAEAQAPEPAEEEAPAPELPTAVEVEFNGQKYEVPPELKDALMREQDYTSKTQTLAQTRKAVELQQREIVLAQERQQFEQSMAEHVDQLKMLDAYIKHVNQTTNWSGMSADEMVRAKLQVDQLKDQKVELERALQNSWSQFQEKSEAERSKIRSETEQELSKAIPKWSEVKSAVENYVQGLGYPEVAVKHMSLLDYQVAHKAMQFDKLQSQKGDAIKKAAQPKGKVITPSSRQNPMSNETKSYLNFRKKVEATKNDTNARKRAVEDRIGDKFERLFGG